MCSFSDNWEWFFGILGGVGIMATLVRAILGKPKLEFEFRVVGVDGGQSLICLLRNSPSRNLIMKALFVPRPRIDEVSVRCEVVNRSLSPTSLVGEPFLADMVTVDKKVSKQLPLPASELPVWFNILAYSNAHRCAWLWNAQEGDCSLSSGTFYVVSVVAYLGDRRVRSHAAGCFINDGIELVRRLPEAITQGA